MFGTRCFKFPTQTVRIMLGFIYLGSYLIGRYSVSSMYYVAGYRRPILWKLISWKIFTLCWHFPEIKLITELKTERWKQDRNDFCQDELQFTNQYVQEAEMLW